MNYLTIYAPAFTLARQLFKAGHRTDRAYDVVVPFKANAALFPVEIAALEALALIVREPAMERKQATTFPPHDPLLYGSGHDPTP